ncbi:hypothetical protein CRM22_009674 [Opisthorchis felineus]|uniref:Glycolipid transfer protein domain-containing protein n=1 Tax=Opisthorchis felineus TaxID=147828 RepID=A0A4S2L6E8_OPIFE|nr:hypothetical protein CRM22_009674 [Opisthorchis felineus]
MASCEGEDCTFFSRIPKIDDSSCITVELFMSASSILTDFLVLWGKRFYLVKADVDGNIKKVSNAVRDLNVTHLRDMLLQEQTLHLSKKDSSGSVGLLWLKRTYEFLIRTLWHLSQSASADSMYDIIIKAYDETLTKYHNRLMRHTFKLILHSLPKRSSFIKKLAYDHDGCERQSLSAHRG